MGVSVVAMGCNCTHGFLRNSYWCTHTYIAFVHTVLKESVAGNCTKFEILNANPVMMEVSNKCILLANEENFPLFWRTLFSKAPFWNGRFKYLWTILFVPIWDVVQIKSWNYPQLLFAQNIVSKMWILILAERKSLWICRITFSIVKIFFIKVS